MTRCIYQKVSVALKISLLSCSLPLLLSSTASSQEQNCTQAQIQANIAKFKDSNKYILEDAVAAVAKCEAEAVKALIETLKDKEPIVRSSAADALGRIGESAKSAVPQLIETLKQDQDKNVRTSAASALGSIGESAKPAVPRLIETLKQDQDKNVRSYAAIALGSIGESAKSAVAQLIETLKQDKEAGVRSNAAYALASIGESAKSAVPQLIETVKQDKDKDVRRYAAYALWNIGESAKSAVPQLIETLKQDKDKDVRSHLVQSSRRIAVYLPAKKCDKGVMEAIQAKLHGPANDPDFLQNLIYSGAIDICIDGLNEVTPDTRAKITSFVERYFKGNMIMATQPLEANLPSTTKTYRLQPLKREQVEQFLVSRQTILPADALVSGSKYEQECKKYLVDIFNKQLSEDEQVPVRRMLSNPMELTVVAQMLASGKKPDLLNLQQQQYDIMAMDYERVHPEKEFPLKAFSETVYQMRLDDKTHIPAEEWQDELQCMERYKMVLTRQVEDDEGKSKSQWCFRHDKIQEFFIVQTFLGEGNELPIKHISDPRFRGVYFLLANLLPLDAALELRETLIQYAANTKDHTVSDTFIQVLLPRQVA